MSSITKPPDTKHDSISWDCWLCPIQPRFVQIAANGVPCATPCFPINQLQNSQTINKELISKYITTWCIVEHLTL